MCGIIIVVLLILIVCTIYGKLYMGILSLRRLPPMVPVMPMGSFKDLSGKKIKGGGLTPVTTPGRRSCTQLMVPHSQETSLLRPGDL
jgi:hypothetical protein